MQKSVSSPWLVIRLELEVMPEPEAAMAASAMMEGEAAPEDASCCDEVRLLAC